MAYKNKSRLVINLCECGKEISAYAKNCKPCHHERRITGYFESCKQCGIKFWKFLSEKQLFCSQGCAGKNKKGILFTKNHRDKISNALKGRVSPTLGMKFPQLSKRMSLNNNPNWQGGKSFEPYAVGWTKLLKEEIRKRDNYKCVICEKPQKKSFRSLDIHHIDYNKKNISISNLVTLCINCHMKTNFNRKEWISFFSEKISKS